MERADAIDRQRLDAEERLRAAQAELERERASLIAAKRDTTELQAAFDRRGTRLAEAEIEVSCFGVTKIVEEVCTKWELDRQGIGEEEGTKGGGRRGEGLE